MMSFYEMDSTMKRLFDFTCERGHTEEQFIDSEINESTCTKCDSISKRIISGTSFKLDHTFPGANMKWARDHERAAKRK